jgi:hypothetical protein
VILKLLILLMPLFCLSKKERQLVLYEAGRPATVEYNNAKRETAKTWKFRFEYLNDSILEKLSPAFVDKHNLEVFQHLEKMHGKNWQARFYQEVDEMLARHNILRNLIMGSQVYHDLAAQVFEPYVLFERASLAPNPSWTVHIVGQRIDRPDVGFRTLCQFTLQSQETAIAYSCFEQALTIRFPENGIF